MSPTSPAASTYRPEIQGLRAIAALLVATFHIWLGRVSGGVDVFFVVSGYLITTSLLGQIARNQRIDLVRFWGGLAKRLLPAALLVIAAVILASMLWLPMARWADTIREVVASILYVENWQLAANAIDYLDRENAVSPLQHFWALSVQGQFYLLWPLLLGAGLYLATRLQARSRQVLSWLLAVVFSMSLGYSIFVTTQNQPFAYFNTFARVWEFTIGALLAMVIPALQVPALARLLMGWLGLLAILACGLLLKVSTVFPGYAALWPTLGAALVIAAGTSGHAFGADRLLASRPLARLGDLAYALYLWHWPVLVFYRLLLDRSTLTLMDGLLVLLPSLLLAAATHRWVENPARYSSIGREKPLRSLIFGGACAAAVLALAAGWTLQLLEARREEQRTVELGGRNYPGALALEEDNRNVAAKLPLYPGPLSVGADLPAVYADGCHQTSIDAEVLRCVYGSPNPEQTVALIGGSHAAHWLPALQAIADQNRWRILTFTKGACHFYADLDDAVAGVEFDPSCTEWNQRVLAELQRDKPHLVFTTATTMSGGMEVLPQGLVDRWRELEAMGIRVIAIRDTPWMAFAVAECVEREGAEAAKCTRSRHDARLQPVSPITTLRDPPRNVHFVDLTDYFCDESVCFPTAGNVVIYRDQHHITASYARTLGPVLQRRGVGERGP